MMQHQGPRSSDGNVDVQDLLRSLPTVGAADGFEQNLMKRVEAENLNVAFQLSNLPKVPAVGDFNDRLHWSIAVHNQISGGVATEAVEVAAIAAQSTGGRIWLRTGLLLLAVAIGFSSWAVMGDGTARMGTSAAKSPAGPVSTATPSAAPAPTGSVRVDIPAITDPVRSVPAAVAAGTPAQPAPRMIEAPARIVVPVVVQTAPVSSAVKSATLIYGSTAPVEGHGQPTTAPGRDASPSIQIEISTSESSHTQPSIQTGAPEQASEGSETPTDSIHTGEHRTDDPTPLAP